MKIKKLIKIFEKCLKNYQKGYDQKYEKSDMILNHLQLGICFHCKNKLNISLIYDLFNNGYYIKLTFTENGYLFPLPNNYKDLLPRINWLKKNKRFK